MNRSALPVFSFGWVSLLCWNTSIQHFTIWRLQSAGIFKHCRTGFISSMAAG